ncbi:ABC transporter substrate-binding protein [Roseburia sp. AM59-24XD]|jgi:putative ABC transport system substrate-binding protein|uniref:ABC transporter substrate-binding protein n=1 Tax=Roseburia sp. AM59-24XD TaxID=2293138 RepID=UPI000E50E33E|nr:ABC transporter substrate-binding protein [Roseburia sp. AM59-24XD]RHP82126.1 ABC transporter substrate-binding protein [Roseburia sp. AM59-24XD]
MKKTFKKLLSVALASTMVVGLAGCGNSATTNGGSDSTADKSGKTYTIGICQLVQHEALDAATDGFKKALKDKLGDKVKFDEQNAAGDAPTCSTICTSFVTNNYDLILGNATAALQAAVSSTDSIPVLGTSVTDYGTALDISDWNGVTGKNVSGTTDLAPLDQQAKCIKELFPDAKNIGIIYCSSEPNSIYQSTTITKYLEDEGYKIKEYTFADSNDVASVTKSACDASDVIYIPTDNTAASCTEAINNVAGPAKTPIFAGEEGIAKGCGVATLSISYYDLGYETGEMAYDILVNDADITKMEVKTAPKFTKEYIADRADDLKVTVPDDYEKLSTK